LSENPGSRRIEQYAWIAFVACVALVPLAVAKLPFLPQALTFDVFAFPQNVTLALGAAVALGLWGVALGMRQTALTVSRPMIAFGVFAAWSVVATAFGYDPLRSLFGVSTAALSLVNILAISALFFLAVQMVDSRGRMRTLTWAVIAPSTLVALLALLQQLFHTDVFGTPGVESWLIDRGFSTFGNPDHLGTFLVLPVVVGAVLALLETETRDRAIATACSVTMLAALTGTLTRGAWIAVVVGFVLAGVLVWRVHSVRGGSRWVLIVVGIALAAVVVILATRYVPDLAGRFRLPTHTEDGGVVAKLNALSSDRINLWISSGRMIAERPLTGTGPDAYGMGWLRQAIKPSSGGGGGGLATDPHSFLVYVAATTGLVGVFALLAGIIWALILGARTAFSLTRGESLSGASLYYVAWFVGAVALQVALLVAATNGPVVMYAFISLALLLRPSAKRLSDDAVPQAVRWVTAALSLALAAGLIAATAPALAAETAMGPASQRNDIDAAQAAAERVPWNTNVQAAYFQLRTAALRAALTTGSSSSRTQLEALLGELEAREQAHPRELYYPSLRAQLLTQASESLADPDLAKRAVEAADDALAVMPAHITTRVNRALALSYLERWDDMAATLKDYWRNELGSPYPGLLYAQALAFSGDAEASEKVFAELAARFPNDTSIETTRLQTQQAAEQGGQ